MDENCNKGKWYVVHVLSGHENKVRESILRKIRTTDDIPVYEVYIPEEKVSEVRQRKTLTTTRKFFPGYILIRMDLYMEDGIIQRDNINEKTWFFIRNIQGILGFVGGANVPVPLSESEAEDMLKLNKVALEVRPKVVFEIGEVVNIKEGAFENFEGSIQEIDNERGKLKLLVSIFGRSTPVELDFGQVERLT